MYLGKLNTVKDLKDMIEDYPDDKEIVIDVFGNEYCNFDINQIGRSCGSLIEISVKG